MASLDPVCANACSNKQECIKVGAWFTCGHLMCINAALHCACCIECGKKVWADPRPFGSAVETHAYLQEQIKPELQRLVGVAINAAADEMIASEPKPTEMPKPAKTIVLFPRTEMDPKIIALIKKRVVEGKCTMCGIKLPDVFMTTTSLLKSDMSTLVMTTCVTCIRS